jgi:hypothetical protein
MRPVNRGRAPRKYTKYQQALSDLEGRLDRYCSYCERRFLGNLAVEHIAAKSRKKSLKNAWKNFLLGCGNCNSAKGSKRTNDTDFLWPDRDNTLLAISYKKGGLVEASSSLSPGLQKKAKKLIALVGLDRHPGQTGKNKRPAKRDQRYRDREEVWSLATEKLQALAGNNNPDFRDAIAGLAKYSGFFSVWMAVFDRDPDMRRRFVAAIKGTATNCFDANWNYVRRAGGRL